MKKTLQLLLLLAALSAVSGYLMSQMSFIGRVGINLVHQEYKFLKVWWQGALAVYVTLLVLFAVHALINRVLSFGMAKVFHVLFFFAAIGGMYFTYNDFADDFTHKLMRQRFHLGAYLFWVGWMMIAVFFTAKKKKLPLATISDNTAATTR